MRIPARSVGVLGLLTLALVACGSLLSIEPDTDPQADSQDATPEGASSTDGARGGDGGATPPPDGATDATPEADGGFDANAPPDQKFFTDFEGAQATLPCGWEQVVSAGGGLKVQMSPHVKSVTNNLKVDAIGGVFLSRPIDPRMKTLLVTAPLYVERFATPAMLSSVDVIEVACGGTAFGRVQLDTSGHLLLLLDPNGRDGTAVGSGLGMAFHTIRFQVGPTSGGQLPLTLGLDSQMPTTLNGPACLQPITLRLGANYTGTQDPALSGNGYVYDFDDVEVEVWFN
jgi:hypothetical protein